MPRPLTWRQLLPGVLIILAIFLAALAVLLFARVGSLHGDSYRLYVLSDEARGVIEGTEVWLVGQKVGAVHKVSFRPASNDSLGHLVVALDILARYKPAIRGDSRAEFRNGSTPIGATIVSISAGSPTTPVLEENDTIPRASQIDPDSVRAALSAAASQMPELLTDAEQLAHSFRVALGRSAGDSTTRLTVIAARAARLARRLDAGGGTLARISSDTALRERLDRIAVNYQALLDADSASTLSRAVKDTLLSRRISAVRDQIAEVRRQLDEERGTAGRLVNDEALLHQLRLLEAKLDGSAKELGAAPRTRAKP